MNYITEQLKKIEQRGFKLTAVAKEAGTNSGNLYRMRNGKRGCDPVTAAKLVKWSLENGLDFSFEKASPGMARILAAIGYKKQGDHKEYSDGTEASATTHPADGKDTGQTSGTDTTDRPDTGAIRKHAA